MSTDTFNLTLPKVAHPNTRWLTPSQLAEHHIQTKARLEVLTGLLAAISPELGAPVVNPYWRAELGYAFGSAVTVEISFTENGFMEVVVKRYSRRETFKRFKVAKDTGALDPRVVEGVRELVAYAKEVVVRDAKSRENEANAKASKLIHFGHAKRIVAEQGLEWVGIPLRDTDTSGTIKVGQHRLDAEGGTVKLELHRIPVERLAEVVAFLKTMEEVS